MEGIYSVCIDWAGGRGGGGGGGGVGGGEAHAYNPKGNVLS